MNDSVKPEQLSVADRLTTLSPEVQQLFAGDEHEHGTPDNISKAGCLALARLGKDAWNAWRGAFPVGRDHSGKLTNCADFSGHDFRLEMINFAEFHFGDAADFSNTYFGREACFRMTRWGECAKLNESEWGPVADFRGARWGMLSSFDNSIWGSNAQFSGAQWALEASFKKTQWGPNADFSGSQWRKANFTKSEWLGYVSFSGMSWDELSSKVGLSGYLQDAKSWADANGLSPDSLGETNFQGAKFVGRSSDGTKVTFRDRKFVFKANFGCDFGVVPEFHGSELHQDTSFDGAEFPPATGSDEAARAYRTLKLAFSKQQALREEQRFFRLEMAEEAKSSGKAQPLYWLYRVSSDYGFSLWRPFVAFLVLLLVFAQVYGLYDASVQSCWPGEAACEIQRTWLNFSLSQSMPLPGFDKQVPSENSIRNTVPICFIAIHKVLAFILSFLIGLALRNLFRLK